MSDFRTKHLHSLGLLALIWAIAIALVNPTGDFPLNDDFSFARSVFNFSERGVLEFDNWLSMSLITQVLWGAGFTKIFGFSFEVLRYSNLLAAFLASVGLYFIARDLGQGKWLSLIAALSISFSPILFSLSFTFMSDVPFLALCVWATFAFNRAFASGKIKWVVIGSLLAIAATFLRQLGFMLPAAFALTYLVGKKWKPKNLLTGLPPLVFTAILYVMYMSWFEKTQGLPETYGTFSMLGKRLGKPDFAWSIFYRIGILAGYIGVFLLPLVVAIGQWKIIGKKAGVKFSFSKKQTVFFSLFLMALLLSLIPAWDKTFWGNIFYNFGLGPKALKDGQFFMNVHPRLGEWGIGVVKTFFSLSGILLIISILPSFFTKLKKTSSHFLPALFASFNLLIYGGFLMLNQFFFDRYFIQLLPFAMVMLLPLLSKYIPARKAWFCAVAFLIVGGFSIMATHDYLSWNRARWQALDHLTEEMKITPDRIDGGFEFNGWHRVVPERTYGGGRSWWWVKNDEYAVTFGKLEGYEKIRGYPFLQYMTMERDSIFILRKK